MRYNIVISREAFWPVSYFFRIRLFPICRARTRTDVCYNDTISRTNRIVIKRFYCTLLANLGIVSRTFYAQASARMTCHPRVSPFMSVPCTRG